MAFDWNREHLAWAGGLFEGEGNLSLQRKVRDRAVPRAGLGMTDADSVYRFAESIQVGRTYGPYERPQGRKPIFNWQAVGFEETQALIALLWPWLGERRRERAKEILAGAGTPVRRRRKDQQWASA
jgi:hypothetical protein